MTLKTWRILIERFRAEDLVKVLVQRERVCFCEHRGEWRTTSSRSLSLTVWLAFLKSLERECDNGRKWRGGIVVDGILEVWASVCWKGEFE